MNKAEGVYLSILILILLLLVVYGYFQLLNLNERVDRLEQRANDHRKSVARWVPNGPPPT